MKTGNYCLILQWKFAILVLALPGLLVAGDVSHIPAAFLDVGLGAGPMGTGGTTVALGKNIYSIVTNPAGIISVSDPEVAFSMTKQFSLIPYNMVLYGQRIIKHTSAGIGLLTSGDDALRENTVYFSVAHRMPYKLAAGLNFKLHFSSFGDNEDGKWIYDGGNRQVQGSAKGFALDLGVKGILSGRILYGLVFKDLLGNVSYDASNEVETATGGSERLPPKMILGLGYVLTQSFQVELDVNKSLYLDTNDRIYTGVEKTLFQMMALRGGFSQNFNASEVNRQYALGLGIMHQLKNPPIRFGIDFAYLINDLHNFFHVGLNLAWNRK